MSEHAVRIFVSSPSDLDHERALVKDVIDALAQEYLPYFTLRAILWEEEALTAAQSFQAGLLRPSECEIVLVMLWTKLGTPLADDPYGGRTGTEWEFIDAVEASARQGYPEVLVYKKAAPRLVDVSNAEITREALADLQRLEAFFSTHFFNADGSFKRAFRQFSDDRSFRDLVETQLRKLLNRRITAERRSVAAFADWQGSPFRTEAPFDLTDDHVFTGRETETRELLLRLERLRGSGRALLIVTGPSGVGKTSLIRAGLMPRLIRPYLLSGVAGCRWCLVDPTERAPIEALALALAAPSMLGPALDTFGLDAERLGRLLFSDPDVAADQIQAASRHLSAGQAFQADPHGGRLHLALVIDPLDPLLRPDGRADPQTAAVIRALLALASRDDLWVIVSLRSDLLRFLPAFPELDAPLDEDRWFPVEPPPSGRIRQVMEIPARVAGIEYEGAAAGRGHGLIELLESEASALEHWPPLLERLLHDLYGLSETRSSTSGTGGHRILTVQDYRQIGGVAGATLRRADALWADLPPETHAGLPVLCRALIALEQGDRAAFSARHGDLDAVVRDPAAARLVEALVAARLLVVEGIPEPPIPSGCQRRPMTLLEDLRRLVRPTATGWLGRRGDGPGKGRAPQGADGSAKPPQGVIASAPTVDAGAESDAGQDAASSRHWADYHPRISFAHPVLYQRWRPIRQWLAESSHRRVLMLRHQVSRQARMWRRTDCNREYLLGEVVYAQAQRLAQDYAQELEPLERAFIEESGRALLFQRRRRRGARLLAGTLAILLVFSSVAALWAWDASRAATLNLQRSLLKAADLAVRQGNTPEAVRLALNAGPYLPESATETLSRAFTTNRLVAMVQTDLTGGDTALSPAFRDDGDRLVTQSTAVGSTLWTLDGDGFRRERQLSGPELPIHSVRFVADGTHELILGIGQAGVWRLPADAGQPPDWTCGGRPDTPIAVSANGRFVALSHGAPNDRFAVCVLDLQAPGAPLWDLPLHASELRSLAFSPDAELLVTASRDGTARVLEVTTGRERLLLPTSGALGRPANDATFDPTGQRIAVASADERVRIYDLEGREQAAFGVIERGGRQIRIHKSAVRASVFDPSGRYLIAGDDAGQVVRWDIDSGQPEILGRHDLSVEQVRVASGDRNADREPLILSASLDKTARLWGLFTGAELAVFSHDAAVTDARFSRNGERVLTYSDLDGSARLWSVRPTQTLAAYLPSADHVWNLAFASAPTPPDEGSDGEPRQPSVLLATAAFDGRVEVWGYDRGDHAGPPVRLWTLIGHQGRVRRVTFSSAADVLASAGQDGTARVWNLSSGASCTLSSAPDDRCQGRPERGCPNVHQALFTPDGGGLLTTSSDPRNPIRLWDIEACAPDAGAPDWDLGGAGAQAAAVRGSEDGSTWVAIGNDLGEVRVWRQVDDATWMRVCAETWHRDAVIGLAFSPDGRWLASASEDGQAMLVSLVGDSCAPPRVLAPDAGQLYDVAFAPDSRALVTAALAARAQVWSVDGRLQGELIGHKDRVYTAEFSPDGRWVLTASRDGTVRVWQRPDAVTDEPIASFLTLTGELGGVAYATFSPDGNAIGAAYWENATLLWRLWTEDQTPDRRLEATWGPDRARLALVREAVRFKQRNHLDRATQTLEDARSAQR